MVAGFALDRLSMGRGCSYVRMVWMPTQAIKRPNSEDLRKAFLGTSIAS